MRLVTTALGLFISQHTPVPVPTITWSDLVKQLQKINSPRISWERSTDPFTSIGVISDKPSRKTDNYDNWSERAFDLLDPNQLVWTWGVNRQGELFLLLGSSYHLVTGHGLELDKIIGQAVLQHAGRSEKSYFTIEPARPISHLEIANWLKSEGGGTIDLYGYADELTAIANAHKKTIERLTGIPCRLDIP